MICQLWFVNVPGYTDEEVTAELFERDQDRKTFDDARTNQQSVSPVDETTAEFIKLRDPFEWYPVEGPVCRVVVSDIANIECVTKINNTHHVLLHLSTTTNCINWLYTLYARRKLRKNLRMLWNLIQESVRKSEAGGAPFYICVCKGSERTFRPIRPDETHEFFEAIGLAWFVQFTRIPDELATLDERSADLLTVDVPLYRP